MSIAHVGLSREVAGADGPATLSIENPARKRLSPRISLGLDAARAFAACYVALHHLAYANGLERGVGVVFRFGQEAVLVFFLLSGFLIFVNERDRTESSGYFLRRLRRIYPILLFAMLVSTLVALDNGNLAEAFKLPEFLGTLLSLQDVGTLKPGVLVNAYLGNAPLWSLSYEVPFYLAFPLVLAAWKRHPARTNHLIGLACCALYALYVCWPNHFALVGAYFLVWWVGAMAGHAYLAGARNAIAIGAPLVWLLLLCVEAGAAVYLVGYNGLGLYPFLPFRHFAVAALMLCLFFSPLGAGVTSLFTPARGPILFVASISYAVYVLHYPVMVQWHRTQGGLGIAAGIGIALLLAWLAERKLLPLVPKAPKG